MQDIKIQINFNEKTINLNGSTTLGDFKKYIDSLRIEDAVMIQKNVQKQMKSYLQLFPKQQKVKPVPPIETEDKTKTNWKEKYFELKSEFDNYKLEMEEFKRDIKEYVIDLKNTITILSDRVEYLEQENKELKDKVDYLELKANYYDQKYDNEYERIHGLKLDSNQNPGPKR